MSEAAEAPAAPGSGGTAPVEEVGRDKAVQEEANFNKTLKNSECCALCSEKFSFGQSFTVPSPFRKSGTGRMKHMCRVCTRVVCKMPDEQIGCCSMQKVPASLWSRSMSSMRKPDPKSVCSDCSGACTCGEGWVCKDCTAHLSSVREEYRTLRDRLEGSLARGEGEGVQGLLQHPYLDWVCSLDCDDGDDVRRMVGMSNRLARARALFEKGTKPTWPRPGARQRAYSKQVTKTALRAGEEVLNLAAWGKIKLGYKAFKMAATGYRLSEQITHYILSDEFMQAWQTLLQQLGEFAEYNSRANQVKHTDSYTRKGIQALDLCKRFYYYSLHLLLHRISSPDLQTVGEPCTDEQLSSAVEYLPMMSMLYLSHRGGRPSLDPIGESAWFLSHIVGDDLVLLEYQVASGADKRFRSGTRGAKHPAFALLVNRAKKHLVLAVRGTYDKNDHLMDLDLADSKLSEEDGSGVHRGMLNGARYILDEWGLRGMIAAAPRDHAIRLVGHSLGAGIVALIGALLSLEEEYKDRDIKVVGYGMPACVSPELSLRLKGFVTAVVHREDAVPRLSFTNLVKLSEDFNKEEEKDWCRKQLARDYADVWEYLGFKSAEAEAEADAEAEEEVAIGSAAAGELLERVVHPPPNIARDLVAAGTVIHLKQMATSGEYVAVTTDYTDEELGRIIVTSRCIQDHKMESYTKVLRGLNLRKRLSPDPHGTRTLQSALDEVGNYRPCSICLRDVCDIQILKSDAHRASATKHCMQCGRICCVECAPADDAVPDFEKELGATRKTHDYRTVIPDLGTLEPQRMCAVCQLSPQP